MKISLEKKQKIQEQIISTLLLNPLKPLFTAHIAREIARDEEFTKDLLIDLKNKKVLVKINKNPQGEVYSRRIRWKLSREAHKHYI